MRTTNVPILPDEFEKKISSLTVPVPKEEYERLKIIAEANLNDPNYSTEQYDRYINLIVNNFNAPIAAVSIAEVDHVWFKSKYGLTVSEIPRDFSLCSYTILEESPEVLIVHDTHDDYRTANNPLACGEGCIRFYAGSPIIVNGMKIGAICLMDTKPREGLTRKQHILLQDLALCLSDAISLRRNECIEAEKEKERWHKNIVQLVKYPVHDLFNRYANVQDCWKQLQASHECVIAGSPKVDSILANLLIQEELVQCFVHEVNHFEQSVNEIIGFTERILSMLIRILYISQLQKHQRNAQPLYLSPLFDSPNESADKTDSNELQLPSPSIAESVDAADSVAVFPPFVNKQPFLDKQHDLLQILINNTCIHNMLYFDMYDLEFKISHCLWQLTRLPQYRQELSAASPGRSRKGNSTSTLSLSACRIEWDLVSTLPDLPPIVTNRPILDRYLFSQPDLIITIIHTIVTLSQLRSQSMCRNAHRTGELSVHWSKLLHQSKIDRNTFTQLFMLQMVFVISQEDTPVRSFGENFPTEFPLHQSMWTEEEQVTLTSLADIVSRIGGELQIQSPTPSGSSSVKSFINNKHDAGYHNVMDDLTNDKQSALKSENNLVISCFIPCYILSIVSDSQATSPPAPKQSHHVNVASVNATSNPHPISTEEMQSNPNTSTVLFLAEKINNVAASSASDLLRGLSFTSLYRQQQQNSSSMLLSNNDESSIDQVSCTSEQEQLFTSSSVMMSLPYTLSMKLAKSLKNVFFSPQIARLTQKQLQKHHAVASNHNKNNNKVYVNYDHDHDQDNLQMHVLRASSFKHSHDQPFQTAVARDRSYFIERRKSGGQRTVLSSFNSVKIAPSALEEA